MDRGPSVVGQVDGDLGALPLADVEAQRLDLGQAAVAAADGACHPLGHRDVGGGQVGVVRDEHRPGADGHDACGRMHTRLADVWVPGGVGPDGVPDAFELPGTHPRKILALRQPSGLAVQVDGDLQLLPHPGAEPDGEIDRLLGGGVAQRHEGDHVGGAHPWMLALVVREVDESRRHPHHAQYRIHERRPLADERDHTAVVVGVLFDVDQRHPWSILRLGHDEGDLRLVPAF